MASGAYLDIARSDNYALSNTLKNDIIFQSILASQKIHLASGSNVAPKLTITSNNIGINTVNPQSTLDIVGSLNVSSNITMSSSNSRLGIGNSNPQYSLDVSGITKFSSNVYIQGGKLGIGTTNPYVTLYINSNDAIRIPSGTSANRPIIGETGMVRFNTDTSQYEGYANNNWVGLGGVIDVDQNTKITAEDGPGINNNQLKFYIGSNNNINSNLSFIIDSNNRVGVGTSRPNVIFDIRGNDALQLPCGTSNDRSNFSKLWSSGQIRFNTNTMSIEYCASNVWYTLGNSLMDADKNTKILTEISPGSNNNQIQFYTDGILSMTIDSNQKIGIGRTDPSEVIDVGGNIRSVTMIAPSIFIGDSNNIFNAFTENTNNLGDIYYSHGNIGFGTTNPQGILDIKGKFIANTIEDFEYPPLAMTSDSTVLSDGTYKSSCSSNYTTSYPAWKVFDKIIQDSTNSWIGTSNSYYGSNGLHLRNIVTSNIDGKNSNLGDWIQLQTPYNILVSKYKIYNRYNYSYQAPVNFSLLGSSDSTTWTTIDSQINNYWHKNNSNNTYVNLDDALTFYTFNNSNYYNYYRLSINKIAENAVSSGGSNNFSSNVAIGEIKFYGKKQYDTTLNTINLVSIYTVDNNIGIGTTSPHGRLQINNINGMEDTLILANGGNSNEFYKPQITFGYSNSSDYAHYIGTRHDKGYSSNNAIDFYCCNSNQKNSIIWGSTPVMSLIGSGNVGIGTTTPNTALHITSVQPILRLQDSTGTTANTTFTYISFYNNISPTPTITGYIGYIGTGDLLIFNSSATTGGIRMYTNGTERLAIGNNGYIGIGTTNPSANLHISTSIALLKLQDSTATTANATYAYISFMNNISGGATQNGYIGYYGTTGDLQIINSSATTGGVRIYTAGSERLTILNGGYVGIGTTNPSTLLHVNGSLTMNSTNSFITFGGNSSLGTPGTLSGTKLVFFGTGSSTNDYSMGINSGTLWYNVINGAKHSFCINGTENAYINSSGLTVSGVTTLGSTLNINKNNIIINGYGASSTPELYLRFRKEITAGTYPATAEFYLYNKSIGGGYSYAYSAMKLRMTWGDGDSTDTDSFVFFGDGSLNATKIAIGYGTTYQGTYQLQLSTDSAAKTGTNTWTIASDIRLKTNIEVANYNRCYEIMSNLDLKQYTWRDDIPELNSNCIKDRKKLGWIADDVLLYYPKAVNINSSMYGLSNVLDLNSDQIYACMYGTIKQLMKDKELMEDKINNLELQNTEILSQLYQIRSNLNLI